MAKPKKRRLEDIECEEFAKFLTSLKLPFMRVETNIPTKNMGAIIRLKREGWQAGYSDYVITLPIVDKRGHITHCGLFLEMKKKDGAFPVATGKDAQYDFLMEKAHLQYASFCCRGAEAAIKVVENYLVGIIESLYEKRMNDSRLKCVARCYNELLK